MGSGKNKAIIPGAGLFKYTRQQFEVLDNKIDVEEDIFQKTQSGSTWWFKKNTGH